MNVFLTVLHVIVCIFLVAVVLLQRGKGAEIGAVFGGGASSTVFGSRGAGNFLTKLTTASAAIFMITSLALAYMGNVGADDQLFEDLEDEPAVEESLFEEVGTVPAPATTAAPEAEAPADADASESATGLPALSDPTGGGAEETP